jgi:hypothetical protein
MTDWKEEIDQSIEICDQAFKQYRDEGVEWSRLQTADLPFRNLCIEIMNAVTREYHHLKVGAQEAPQFAAWAARNLLELKIITAYVLVSKTNADRFIDDVFRMV